jgi:hypothetical protein
MSAVEALKAARAAGFHLGIDGDDLVLEAPAPPPPAVIDLLSRHKAEVVALLLRPAEDGWSAEDWQIFFDERAGIVEFDGGLPRAEAEAQAFACCVVEWLNHNPERSPAGRCLDCGGLTPATHGCIRAAGPPGTRPGRPRPPPHWRRWGSRRRSVTRWSGSGNPSTCHQMRRQSRARWETNLPSTGK